MKVKMDSTHPIKVRFGGELYLTFHTSPKFKARLKHELLRKNTVNFDNKSITRVYKIENPQNVGKALSKITDLSKEELPTIEVKDHSEMIQDIFDAAPEVFIDAVNNEHLIYPQMISSTGCVCVHIGDTEVNNVVDAYAIIDGIVETILDAAYSNDEFYSDDEFDGFDAIDNMDSSVVKCEPKYAVDYGLYRKYAEAVTQNIKNFTRLMLFYRLPYEGLSTMITRQIIDTIVALSMSDKIYTDRKDVHDWAMKLRKRLEKECEVCQVVIDPGYYDFVSATKNPFDDVNLNYDEMPVALSADSISSKLLNECLECIVYYTTGQMITIEKRKEKGGKKNGKEK